MEKPPRNHKPVSPEFERRHKEGLREQLFQQLVARKTLERFAEDLEEAGVSTEDIRELGAAFGAFSEEDKRATLAYPAVLRPKLFERYAAKLESNDMTPAQVVEDMRAKAAAAGFTLGFHLSQADIQPAAGDWIIRGTEKDHRHNDLPMAYYSLDYTHRYLKKPSRFLYLVRVELKDESGHYQDNDGSWGHAPSLSVVDKINMIELEQELDERMRELLAPENRKEAA